MRSDPQDEQFVAAPCYAPLRWSAEKPAAAGWWWMRGDLDHREIVLLREDSDGRMRVEMVADDTILDFSHCYFDGMRWAGPLPEPLEPPIVSARTHNDRSQVPPL